MAKQFHVTCVPGGNPNNSHLNKKEWQGEAGDEKGAIEAWKSLNGLDGIGVENWPLAVKEVAVEAAESTGKNKKG